MSGSLLNCAVADMTPAGLGISFESACRDYLPTLQRTAATQAELMRHVMRRQYERVMDDYELTDLQAYLGEMTLRKEDMLESCPVDCGARRQKERK